MDLQRDRPAELRFSPAKLWRKRRSNSGSLVFQTLSPDVDAAEIQVAVAEAEQRFRAAHFQVKQTAFLLLVGMAGVEHHAVAGLERASS